MALSFAKKATQGAAVKKAEPEKQEASSKPSAPAAATKPQHPVMHSSVGWMKKGKAAKAALEYEEAKAEMAQQEAGKLWSVLMKPDEERRFTFLDGDLSPDGLLDIPMYYQHQIKVGDKWQSFVCIEDDNTPCPICEKGENKRALVGVMTVIDHTPYTVTSGTNAGKTYQYQRRLFICKRTTIKLLTKLAGKRGGLAGCTFDVQRTSDKAPSVGDQFDFVDKMTIPEIRAKYNLTEENVTPANYEEEIVYRTAEELIALGVGKAQAGPGFSNTAKSKSDLANEL